MWPVHSQRLSLRLSTARDQLDSTLQREPISSNGVVAAFSAAEDSRQAQTTNRREEAKLHAIMQAVAAGPSSNHIFLVMVNQAAAEHHLPLFLRTLRLLQARDRNCLWTLN